MKRLLLVLPLLAILAELRTPANRLLPHWGILHPSPFLGIVLLLVLGFMAGSVFLGGPHEKAH